jgi:hypothetical protein
MRARARCDRIIKNSIKSQFSGHNYDKHYYENHCCLYHEAIGSSTFIKKKNLPLLQGRR